MKRKRFTCKNGLSFSLQTNQMTYCSPRKDRGPWHEVEIGFPSEAVERLMPYAEGYNGCPPTEDVYAYVPVWVVLGVIEDAGGLIPEDESRMTIGTLGPNACIY